MFILKWNDGLGYYTVCGEYKALWQIYWALKESLKNTRPNCDCYMTDTGVFVDLESGHNMKYVDVKDALTLLKKRD